MAAIADTPWASILALPSEPLAGECTLIAPTSNLDFK